MPELLVPDMLAERARAYPDGVALVVVPTDGPPEPLTFGDWQAGADAVAYGLAGLGVRPGDRVALLGDERDWRAYAVAYIGLLRAGAAAVPLSSRLTAPELGAAGERAGCVGLVATAAAPAAVGIGGWRAAAADLIGGPAGPLRVERSPDDLAQVLYTSGATGTPALVGASHRNVLAGWTPEQSEPHDPAQFFVHALPVATNAGHVALLHPLQAPHTAVLLPAFVPEHYVATVKAYTAGHTLLVPAMAAWLLQSEPAPDDLDSVRTVALTAARSSPAQLAALARLFRTATLTNNYTTTEAWPAMTAMTYHPDHPDALGRPLAGQRVLVLDEAGQPVPAGATGEIALASADVPPRAYVGEAGSGRSAFGDGWVRTGDLGYVDADGFLHLVDRRADLIVSGGFNVSSQEVEAALEEHPDIEAAAVLGVPHPVLGSAVVAVVTGSAAVSAAAVREWLGGRLAAYKVPARVAQVDELPRTALGKVRKPALRDLAAAALAGGADGPTVAPGTDDERALLELWQDVLGSRDLGVEDDFLAVGGHSLAAFEIAERASAALGVAVPRHLILAAPTVAAQAVAVAELRSSGPAVASTPIRPRRRP